MIYNGLYCLPKGNEAGIKEQEISFPGRLTAVLEQRKGRWFIMQRHFSVPDREQAEGESFPRK